MWRSKTVNQYFDTTIFEDSNSFSTHSNVFSPGSDIRFTFLNATSSPSRPIRESLSQFENRIMTRVYIRSIIRSSSVLLAGTGKRKISSVACGFSSI